MPFARLARLGEVMFMELFVGPVSKVGAAIEDDSVLDARFKTTSEFDVFTSEEDGV